MNILDIEIELQDSFDETKAIATVFLKGGFEIQNIKVIEGKTGMYVRMEPKAVFSNNGVKEEKRLETEERLFIQKKIIESYNATLEQIGKEKIKKEQDELKHKELGEKELEQEKDESRIEKEEDLILTDKSIVEEQIEKDQHSKDYEQKNESNLDKIEKVEVFSRKQTHLEYRADTEDRIDEILNKNSIKLYNNEYLDEGININELLIDKKRVFPGNELFVSDLNLNPRINTGIAYILAQKYADKELDYIVAVENRGVLLAYEVAKFLNIELVIIKYGDNLNEGSAITVEYEENEEIFTIGISKLLFKENSKCVLIDNTIDSNIMLKAIIDLLSEYNSSLEGVGVMFEDVRYDIDKGKVNLKSLAKYSGADENSMPIIY